MNLMNKKANQTGKVFDKMDKLCTYLLAYDPNCPTKYRHNLWLPMRSYIDQAQACAEMAYLEADKGEKSRLVADARKYFQVFKRYWHRCNMTGEFRFGKVHSVDMLEFIEDIEGELSRWYASQRKLLVGSGVVATSPEHRV